MKNHTSQTSKDTGITLLELTVVILVLIGMISVLFIGAKAYKEGADRAQCVVNIRNVQVAVRSYQNLYILNPGDDINSARLVSEDGGFMDTLPSCPAQGEYTLVTEIPDLGDLALDCSVETDGFEHIPSQHANW